MKRANIGEGSVYQTKTGRWVAAYTIGYNGQGRQVRRTVSAKTKSEVIAKRHDLLDELRRGQKAKGKMTVQTWMTEWLDTTAFHRLSPRVLANYRSINRQHINPTLGQYQIADLGAEEVRELHAAVRQSGASDRTVQIVHGVLSTSMRQAVIEGHLDVNPCDRVERPRARSKQRPALSVMEAKKVIMTSQADPMGSLWSSALLLGARRGELIGLEWNRVDLDNAAVDLSWQVQSIPWAHGKDCGCGDGVKPERCPVRAHAVPPGFEARELYLSRMWVRPKTQSSVRMLPMPAPLVPILRKHRAMFPASTNGLVWHDGGNPLLERDVAAGWKAALRRAGARLVDLHSARHTTASLLLEASVPPEVISQMLGHSEAVTTRGYMHINRRMAEDAMQSLADLLDLREQGMEVV